MNFSNSKNFFSKNFSSQYYKNKFTFKMFNTKLNSNKLLINFQNKLYTTGVNVLNTTNEFKSELVPMMTMGTCFMQESKEVSVLQSLMEMLGSSKKINKN